MPIADFFITLQMVTIIRTGLIKSPTGSPSSPLRWISIKLLLLHFNLNLALGIGTDSRLTGLGFCPKNCLSIFLCSRHLSRTRRSRMAPLILGLIRPPVLMVSRCLSSKSNGRSWGQMLENSVMISTRTLPIMKGLIERILFSWPIFLNHVSVVDYRPISLISSFLKIISKILTTRLS